MIQNKIILFTPERLLEVYVGRRQRRNQYGPRVAPLRESKRERGRGNVGGKLRRRDEMEGGREGKRKREEWMEREGVGEPSR